MNSLRRKAPGAALALILVALAGCESGNYGGSTSVSYGYYDGYYPGGYYPGYYPGGCCWDNDVIVVPPGERPGNGPEIDRIGRRLCRPVPGNSRRRGQASRRRDLRHPPGLHIQRQGPRPDRLRARWVAAADDVKSQGTREGTLS